MSKNDLEQRVAAVRRFKRFVTRQIGVLGEGLLHGPYNLTEAEGFELVEKEEHHSFGKDLIGQNWEITL